MILLKIDVARQARSPSLCASVRAVPWAHEAEQKLSRLAPFGCELSEDFRIFGAGQFETHHREPPSPGYIWRLRWQDKQAASLSVPLCHQCHGQMRRRISFPGYPLLAASCLTTFAFSEQGCWRRPARTPIPGLRVKFKVERQESTPGLCASVRAVKCVDEAEQEISRLTLLAAIYLEIFSSSGQGCLMRKAGNPQAMCRWGWETASQSSPFWLRAIWRRSHFQTRTEKGAQQGSPKIRLKFKVSREASSPSLCASVWAGPWADEAEQQLPRLAPSAWELSGDIRIFEAGLLEAPDTDTPIPGLRFKFEVARQASSARLCASVRAVLWANQLSKSFPG